VHRRCALAGDQTISETIECFPFPRGQVQVEWRNRGWTLYHAATGARVARLRPTGRGDRLDLFYWSYKQRWIAPGPFGRASLPLQEALAAIAHEPVFWTWI
jgi:hypothetical protein